MSKKVRDQQKRTQGQLLEDGANQNRAAREADAAAQMRTYE